MEFLLIKYGYLILFFGIAIEGEAFLLAASYLAHRGYFRLGLIILTAVLSNSAADQIYFAVARVRGRKWLDHRFRQNSHYQRCLGMMSRHAYLLLLASRFAFGFRIIIPAACGALGMPPVKFCLINLLASMIWAVPTALLGFYFGHAAELLLAEAYRYELWIVFTFLIGAALVLLIRHLKRAEWVEDLRAADLHLLAPFAMGLMGLLNLVSAIWPRSHHTMGAVASWLPLEVTQHSRPLMLFAGVALLQVTRNLARRKELAWYVATISLSVSFLLHITRGLDLHHSLVAVLLLSYLIYFRRRFYARSDPLSARRALLMLPLLTLVVLLYGFIGLRHLHHQFEWPPGATPLKQAFNAGILITAPKVIPKTPHALLFLNSLEITGWIARFYLLVMLLRPVILRNRQEAPPDKIRQIFDQNGVQSLSTFAIQTDKNHLMVAGGRAMVAYATQKGVAIACGDPMAPEVEFVRAVEEFLTYSRKNGWTPCFYEAAESRLAAYHSVGLRSLKIAEEALINLPEFSLAGGARANLRAMVNKVAKTGAVIRQYQRKCHPDAVLDEQLEDISQEWLEEKKLGEMGFTLGRFSLEAMNEILVFVCGHGEKVEAFCTWLPYRRGEAVVLDLMRKRQNAEAGTMDFLLAHSLLQLKASGRTEASLANAPLANVTGPADTLERGVEILFENLNAFYGYKNLFKFKKKFAPRWEGRYLVYPKGADLPRVAYAMTAVHISGGLMKLLMKR